jgi:hypothetical protein
VTGRGGLLPSESGPVLLVQSRRRTKLREFVDEIGGDDRVVIEELLAQVLERSTRFTGSRQLSVILRAIFFNKTTAAIKDAEQTVLNLGEHHGHAQAYAHVAEDDLKDAVNRLGQQWGNSPKRRVDAG